MVTYVEELREFRGTLTEAILSEGLEIPRFEGYIVFKEGFVVSYKGKSPKILKPAKCGYKRHYSFIYLRRESKSFSHYIHRLVASAFVENPNPTLYTQVNHIDGNTDNNNYMNLEWVSPQQNSQHAMDTGLSPKGTNCPWSKHTEKEIRQVCLLISQGKTTTEIRAITGTPSTLIGQIRNRKRWKGISCEYDF